MLQRLGCAYSQGYYIAKPMAVEAVDAFVQQWPPPLDPT